LDHMVPLSGVTDRIFRDVCGKSAAPNGSQPKATTRRGQSRPERAVQV
jgi:hypothetical protein